MQSAYPHATASPRVKKERTVIHIHTATLAAGLTCASVSAWALQRDFPTGEAGVNVTYVDAHSPGYTTSCVITITAGLPVLGLSLALHSDNRMTIMLASQLPLPRVDLGSAATVKINSVYIFSKVSSAGHQGIFNVVNLVPIEGTPIETAFDAVNQLVYKTTRVDVVADDSQIRGITLVPEPGLADALTACQHYMLTHL